MPYGPLELFHGPKEILQWTHGSHYKIMVTKDMEITTCIEVIISIDAMNFWAPSMQRSIHGNTSMADYDSISFFLQCINSVSRMRAGAVYS